MANDPIKLVDVGALDRFKTDIENEIPKSIQYSTMPTASAALVGKIIQFTGATRPSSYINGHWYRCEETAVSGTYTWKDLYVDTAIANDDRAITSNGVHSALQNKQDLMVITDDFDLDYKTYDGEIIIWGGTETYYKKGRLYLVSVSPTGVRSLTELSTLTSTETTKLSGIATGATANTVLDATVTIASSDWTGNSAPYSATKTVVNMLATDTPIVDLVVSSTVSTGLDELEAYAYINRAETAADSITFYCYEDKPTVSLTIQLKVFR